MRTLSADALTTRDCELKYYDYRRVLTVLGSSEALACFELATVREPESAEAWAGLSLLFTDRFGHGYADPTEVAPLERPREAARKAMDIDGDNLHANLALANVQFFSGADFREVAERVLRTWPENGEAQAFLGAMFIVTGKQPAAERWSSAPSSPRRRRRAVTTRRLPSRRCARNVSTRRWRRRCGSIRPIGRLASSCWQQRRRWPAGPILRRGPGAACWSWIRTSRSRYRRSCGGGASSRSSPSSCNEGSRQRRVRGRRRDGSLAFALLRGKLVDQGLHLGRELLKPYRRCLREPDEVAELLQAVGRLGFDLLRDRHGLEVQRHEGLATARREVVPRATDQSCCSAVVGKSEIFFGDMSAPIVSAMLGRPGEAGAPLWGRQGDA